MNKLYKNGMKFNSKIARSLDQQIDRIDGNKASLIIVDGGVGEGKTTFTCHCVDYVNMKRGLPPMDLKEPVQYAMGGADFTEKLRLCYEQKLPAIVYDEAGDFNKRSSLSKLNAILNRTFETFRAFKIIVFIVLPNFYALDNSLFEKGIPRLLFHVHSRTKNQGRVSVYNLYRMYYIRNNMKNIVVKPFSYKLTRPNYYGHFLNLDDDRCKQLDKVSTKGKIEALKKAELSTQGLLSLKDLAKEVGKSVKTIGNLLLGWKVKPVKRISRVNYYDESVFNRLQAHYDGDRYEEKGDE